MLLVLNSNVTRLLFETSHIIHHSKPVICVLRQVLWRMFWGVCVVRAANRHERGFVSYDKVVVGLVEARKFLGGSVGNRKIGK